MSEVICGRLDCSYRQASGFCNREFVMMNPGGGCTQMYFNNGQPRPQQWDKVRPQETIMERDEWLAGRQPKSAEGSDDAGDSPAAAEEKENE